MNAGKRRSSRIWKPKTSQNITIDNIDTEDIKCLKSTTKKISIMTRLESKEKKNGGQEMLKTSVITKLWEKGYKTIEISDTRLYPWNSADALSCRAIVALNIDRKLYLMPILGLVDWCSGRYRCFSLLGQLLLWVPVSVSTSFK